MPSAFPPPRLPPPRLPPPRLPHAVGFMLAYGALGFLTAAIFVGALLAADTGGIATVMRGAESWPLPALLLWFLCGLTFGGVQIGAAVMLLAYDDDRPQGGTRIPVAIPVRARLRR